MSAYYNEIDPYAAQQLRNLIDAGRIARGDVDERSIVDVRADDLRGYAQAHFFAGIGGWSLALRLAGWPDDRPVWTGSCPCQPFSLAGKRRGFEDERHLWPEWFRLVREHPPSTLFGEQVAHAAEWVSLVRTDLERAGFAFASRKIRASDVGARHRRNRLWFVAHSNGEAGRLQQGRRLGACRQDQAIVGTYGATQYLADAYGQQEIGATVARTECHPWRSEPSVGRVVDGIPYRLVEPALRALGNAIVPQVAAEFIAAADFALTSGDHRP